jgi:hypothetical protein
MGGGVENGQLVQASGANLVAAAAAAMKLSAAPWSARSIGSENELVGQLAASESRLSLTTETAAAQPASADLTSSQSVSKPTGTAPHSANTSVDNATASTLLSERWPVSRPSSDTGTASARAASRGEAKLAAVWTDVDDDSSSQRGQQQKTSASADEAAADAASATANSVNEDIGEDEKSEYSSAGSSSTTAVEGDRSEVPGQSSSTAPAPGKLSPEEEQLLAEEVVRAMEACSSSLAASTAGALQALGGEGNAGEGGGSTSSQVVGAPMEATLLVQSLAEVKRAANAWVPGKVSVVAGGFYPSRAQSLRIRTPRCA